MKIKGIEIQEKSQKGKNITLNEFLLFSSQMIKRMPRNLKPYVAIVIPP